MENVDSVSTPVFNDSFKQVIVGTATITNVRQFVWLSPEEIAQKEAEKQARKERAAARAAATTTTATVLLNGSVTGVPGSGHAAPASLGRSSPAPSGRSMGQVRMASRTGTPGVPVQGLQLPPIEGMKPLEVVASSLPRKSPTSSHKQLSLRRTPDSSSERILGSQELAPVPGRDTQGPPLRRTPKLKRATSLQESPTAKKSSKSLMRKSPGLKLEMPSKEKPVPLAGISSPEISPQLEIPETAIRKPAALGLDSTKTDFAPVALSGVQPKEPSTKKTPRRLRDPDLDWEMSVKQPKGSADVSPTSASEASAPKQIHVKRETSSSGKGIPDDIPKGLIQPQTLPSRRAPLKSSLKRRPATTRSTSVLGTSETKVGMKVMEKSVSLDSAATKQSPGSKPIQGIDSSVLKESPSSQAPSTTPTGGGALQLQGDGTNQTKPSSAASRGTVVSPLTMCMA